MAKKNVAKKDPSQETFWSKYKLYIFGFVGAVLLISSLGLQSITICLVNDKGEKFAAKMDYNLFGICTSCMGTTDNARDFVEKDNFFLGSKDDTVERAIKSLREIAGIEGGTIGIYAAGMVIGGGSTEDWVKELKEKGYNAVDLESLNTEEETK